MSRIFAPLATVFGVLTILCLTLLVFGFPVVDSLKLMFEGAVGDKFGIHRTIVKSAPLIMVGIGIAIAWRGGVFNIGGEGQLLVGVMLAAAVNQIAPDATQLRFLLLAAAAVGGGLYAWVAAVLFVKRGVSIVISTILLNFIAMQAIAYVVRGPLQEATHSIPQTATLTQAVTFGKPDAQTDLHWGVLIAPIVALVVYLWLMKTPSGFRVRLVGSNDRAARAAKINSASYQTLALVLSGAVCGLAGGVEYVGVSGYAYEGFSPGWGFLGIPVALLGALHPIGVLFSGALFGALVSGAKQLETFGGASFSVIYVVQAAALLGYLALQRVKFSRRRTAEA